MKSINNANNIFLSNRDYISALCQKLCWATASPTPLLSPPLAGTWTGLKTLKWGDGSEQAGLEPRWKVEI